MVGNSEVVTSFGKVFCAKCKLHEYLPIIWQHLLTLKVSKSLVGVTEKSHEGKDLHQPAHYNYFFAATCPRGQLTVAKPKAYEEYT
jgi:hypothetical protein